MTESSRSKIGWAGKLLTIIVSLFSLFLGGCSETGLTDGDRLVNERMNQTISDYILEHYADSYYPTEKQFEVHKIYGAKEAEDAVDIYLYSYFGGFNKSTGLESQAGHSLPAMIRLKKETDGYSVINYIEPEDGDLFLPSLKKMFPRKYVNKALNDIGNIDDLKEEMDSKVKRWLDEER